MDYFTILPGSAAILRVNGVYRQTELYHRADAVYAKHGSGFVKLVGAGATSAPAIRWIEYDPGETAIITERTGFPPAYAGERKVRTLEAAE